MNSAALVSGFPVAGRVWRGKWPAESSEIKTRWELARSDFVYVRSVWWGDLPMFVVWSMCRDWKIKWIFKLQLALGFHDLFCRQDQDVWEATRQAAQPIGFVQMDGLTLPKKISFCLHIQCIDTLVAYLIWDCLRLYLLPSCSLEWTCVMSVHTFLLLDVPEVYLAYLCLCDRWQGTYIHTCRYIHSTYLTRKTFIICFYYKGVQRRR